MFAKNNNFCGNAHYKGFGLRGRVPLAPPDSDVHGGMYRLATPSRLSGPANLFLNTCRDNIPQVHTNVPRLSTEWRHSTFHLLYPVAGFVARSGENAFWEENACHVMNNI